MSGGGSTRWKLVEKYQAFEPLLLDLKETFAHSGQTVYQARNELKATRWGNVAVIIKSFRKPSSFRRYIYGTLRDSKAKRSFENACELLKRGIQTPAPIGYIEYFEKRGLQESFYVSEDWMHNCTLREPLNTKDYLSRTAILAAVGQFAWRMHQTGIEFQDFSPGNILIRKNPKNAQWEFCLVDVNRIRWKSMRLERRMRTFSMLWAEDDDLGLIIDAYCQVSGDNGALAKELAVRFSSAHKRRSQRKEKLKVLLGLK